MGLGTFSGGGLGMGVAFTLEDQFSATADKIESSFAKLDGATQGLSSKVDRSMSQMKIGFGMVAAGALLLAPIAESIKVAADFEQTQIAFETLLGSVDKAKKMLDDLKKFSASTPFQFQDVTEYSKQLLAMGIANEKVIPDLKALGDIASGVGQDKLPQLIHAFGQVNVGAKLSGRELNEFVMAGVPLTAQLAKNLKVPQATVRELAAKSKISFNDVRKALYDLTSGTGMFANLMDKQSHSMLGMWSNVKDNLFQAAVSIGTIFLPMMKRAVDWIGRVVAWLKEFAASPFGQFVFKLVAVIGTLLVVLGTLLMLMGAVRFMAYKTAGAFGAETRAMILNTFATRGLSAGLRQVGKAAWAALGPFVIIAIVIGVFVKIIGAMKRALNSANPYIFAFGVALMIALGPLGWVIGLITLFKRAVAEFNKVGEDGAGKKGGFIGFLQKVGGLIVGVREIWNSWNDDTRTFQLSDTLHKKLQSLGLLQTVVNIGTWIARIKWFLKGVRDAFIEVFTYVKGVIKEWLKKFEPIESKFNKWGTLVDKNRSSMEHWREVGKKVGYVLLIVIGALIVAMLAMGAVALIVLLLFLSPFIIIGYELYKLKQKIDAFKQWWADAVLGATNWLNGLVDWFKALPNRIYEAGVNMVKSLWQGMKDMWTGFTAWLSRKWEGIKNTLGITSDLEYNANIKHINDQEALDKIVPQTNTNTANGQSNYANTLANNKAAQVTQPYSSYQPAAAPTNYVEVPKTVIIPVHLDGRKIADHVIDITKTDDARN